MVAFVTNGLNRMKALHSFSYTPRWIVFIIDVMLSCVAVGVTYLILGNFQLDRINMSLVSRGAICIVGVRIVSFIWGKTYSGIVRFTGTEDALRIYYVLTAGELVLLLGSGAYFLVTGPPIDRYLRAFDGVRVVNEYDDCEPVDCKNSFYPIYRSGKGKEECHYLRKR